MKKHFNLLILSSLILFVYGISNVHAAIFLSYDATGTITDGTYAIEGATVTISGDYMTKSTTTDANGVYVLEGILASQDTIIASYTLTPSKENYNFTPVNRSTTSLTADWLGQDFIGTLTYDISGTITDGINPVADVTITLSGDMEKSTTTNANGVYTLEDINTNGTYTITPSKENYRFDPISKSTSNLSGHLTGQNFLAILEHRYNISGIISDGEDPLANVTVSLTGDTEKSTTTNASGVYLLEDILENGDYTITPSKENYHFNPVSKSTSTLSSHMTSQNFIAVLNKYDIAGTITDGTNVLANVTVTLSGDTKKSTTTNASGNYTLEDINAMGTYTITPSKENYSFEPISKTTTSLNGNLTSQNFVGTLTAKYNISGTITDGTNPLADVTVALSGDTEKSTTTNASGNYTLEEINPNSDYTITPSKENYSFEPISKSTTNLSGHLTDQNFTGTFLKVELDIDHFNEQIINISTIFGNIKITVQPNTFTSGELHVDLTTPLYPATSNIQITPIALEITNDEAIQAQKAIEIVVPYRDSDITDLDETKLIIMRYTTSGVWIGLPSQVDTVNNTVTTTVNHLSKFALVMFDPLNNLKNVKAFPVPFDPLTHTEGLKIANLTKNSTIKIYTILGELVQEFKNAEGSNQKIWDGKNKSGNTVASGVYLLYISDDKGKKVIKIAVEK